MKKNLTALCLAAMMMTSAGALAIEYDLESQGSEVALIQSALLELDYYYGDVTQHYGPRTQRGVRLFQEAYGLEATGVADETTRALLYEITGTTPPDTGDMLLEMNITLRRGDSGSDVVWLQESLAELGHYSGEISGNYGNLTKEAVRLFQRANDIPSDGVAGPVTLAEIAEEIEDLRALEQALSATPAPTPTPQPAATPDRYNGLVQLITPAPTPTAAPVRITPTPKPVSGVNSSAGFLNIQRELKLYDNNEEVRQLQIALDSLGYYSGKSNGYFDFMTRAAVMGYQAAKGIKVSGDADKITLITINDDIFRRYANVVD